MCLILSTTLIATSMHKNFLYYGDNLPIMRAMKDASIDLIYLDPPFNSRANYDLIYAQDKGAAQSEAFSDMWYWDYRSEKLYKSIVENASGQQTEKSLRTVEGLYRALGECGILSYLLYMQVRLLEMRRLLKDRGSLYLHCDSTASHFLKIVLDSIFGATHFRSEIVWWYRKFGRGGTNFKKNHDTILYYAKNREQVLFNELFEDFSPRTKKDKYKRVQVDGKWKQDKSTPMKEVRKEEGVPLSNTWEISFVHSQSKERLGYATQKPFQLLERIVRASSCEGDTVMDPFCGCGTTVDAAQYLGRNWIGIELSYLAVETTQRRLEDRYAARIRGTYELRGTPRSLQAAEELLSRTLRSAYGSEPKGTEEAISQTERDGRMRKKYAKQAGRFEFQRWACSLIGATPSDREAGEPGVDGKLKWTSQDSYTTGAVQVKSSTKVTTNDLRVLKEIISKGDEFVCGVLVCLYKTDTEEIRRICSELKRST